MVEQILGKNQGKKILILSPVSIEKAKRWNLKVREFIKNGYYRIWEEGKIIDLTTLPPSRSQDRTSFSLLIDRLIPEEKNRSRLAEAIQSGFQLGNGKVEVWSRKGRGCPSTAVFPAIDVEEFSEPEPLLFSFNSPIGACPTCQGFGRIIGIDWQKVIPDPKKTLKEKPFAPWNTPAYEDLYEYLGRRAADTEFQRKNLLKNSVRIRRRFFSTEKESSSA